MTNWIAQNIEGKSPESLKEMFERPDILEITRTLAYFLQLPKIQAVI